MAQNVRFKAYWHMVVEAGETYTAADMPITTGVILDTVQLVDAGFLKGAVYNDDGTRARVDDNPEKEYEYALTNLRGVRIKIVAPDIQASGTGNGANVPGTILVGEQMVFDDSFKYECTEGSGVIALGVEETV